LRGNASAMQSATITVADQAPQFDTARHGNRGPQHNGEQQIVRRAAVAAMSRVLLVGPDHRATRASQFRGLLGCLVGRAEQRMVLHIARSACRPPRDNPGRVYPSQDLASQLLVRALAVA
jgi:hypothetical protein